MLYFLLFFGGYLLGMGIGMFIARRWNKGIIDSQKEYIFCLVDENDCLDKKLLEVCNAKSAQKTKKSK